MTAGESARQEARRARERAERLVHRAELFEKGAEGESRTAAALSALGSDWVVLHDHRWPGRSFANIDHVVIGPAGIFVVDSKNWTGDVRVVDQVLRQNGRSREKAVAAAADASLAIAELAGPYSRTVRPVLCFARDESLSGWVRDVMVCSTGNIVLMLRSRPVALDATQVREAALRLDASLSTATDAGLSRGSTKRSTAGGYPPSRTARRRSRAGRGGKAGRGKTSPGRALAVFVGGLLLLLAIPTVLPSAASGIADAFVDQFLPTDKECAALEAGGPASRDRKTAPESRAKRQQAFEECR